MNVKHDIEMTDEEAMEILFQSIGKNYCEATAKVIEIARAKLKASAAEECRILYGA